MNFHGLNVSQDDIECKFFTVISIDCLLVYDSKYYFQVYLRQFSLQNCTQKMTCYPDKNLSEDWIL